MKKLTILLSLILLTACGPDRPEYKERSVEEIYAQAQEYLDDTNWNAAAMEFTEIERQHPESEMAAQGMYMTAYAYFKGDKHVEAIDALDHFLKLHPAHKNVDYALDLKSMIYYNEISDVRREQHATIEALKTMELLTERFPKSPYTKNVEAKIIMLKNYLA
ncbi:MAG: outer membrane protein assembly factor BamD, partial [Alphaproteobacteria bacterium]|nr:outer membrane protein assembly factor BamD [Alphaproteobacteria bacterium]